MKKRLVALAVLFALASQAVAATPQYTITDLGNLGGGLCEANAINSSGQVVGGGYTSSGGQDAFLYSGGSLTDLGSGCAYGINDRGQIVGSNGANQAFIYTGGVMQDLGTFGGSYSAANAVNDRGQIVGWAYYSGNYSSAPFLITSGGVYDLNNLIPANSGWYLDDATGINNSGQICGYGSSPSGNTDAFLLTPTPEPSTLTLLSACAIGLLGFAWRRRRRNNRLTRSCGI